MLAQNNLVEDAAEHRSFIVLSHFWWWHRNANRPSSRSAAGAERRGEEGTHGKGVSAFEVDRDGAANGLTVEGLLHNES